MSQSPKISVLMPVYNGERFLDQSIGSILEQTLADFEFLIVDDGSSDGSLSLLQRYAQSDPRIRLVSRANTGYLVALEEMAARARGKYFARMDADDIAMPDRFAAQAEFMESAPDVVAVGSMAERIDDDGDPVGPWTLPTEHDEIDRAFMAGRGGLIVHPSVMIRATSFRQVGGYRPECYTAEDMDLFLRLAEIGRLANLSATLLKYRLHESQISSSRQSDQIDAIRRSVTDAWHRRGLGEPDLPAHSQSKPDSEIEIHFKIATIAKDAGNYATASKHARRVISKITTSHPWWYCLAEMAYGSRGAKWRMRYSRLCSLLRAK